MKTSIIAGITLLASTALAARDTGSGAAPATQATNYHTVYETVANAYRDVDLTDSSKLVGAFCLGESTAVTSTAAAPGTGTCGDDEDMITVTVSTPAAADVLGCAQLVPYYTSVRDGLVGSIAGALRAVDDNTGTQADLEGLRTSVEEAQKNAHAIEEFCEDLSASLRIHRNTFHAYTSAWANIRFGDGTLSKARMLRAADITHQDVVVNALKSIEHEPEVVLALLA